MEEPQLTSQIKVDYLAQIYALSSTLSNEAISSAEIKAITNGFNVDRGEVSFTELASNLTSARETLRDAIEHQKLIQLPITVQKELLLNLQAISKALQGVMANSDEIVNLGNAVESLNTSIWKYGLHNLSDQVLGYQSKLNQIKQQDVRAKNLLAALEKALVTADRINSLIQPTENATEEISRLRLAVEHESTVASTLRQQVQDEVTRVNLASSNAAQSEAQAGQFAANIKAVSADITPLETSIKTFFSEIDSHRRQLATSQDEINRVITDSTVSVTRLVSDSTAEVESEIDRWNTAAKALDNAQASTLAEHLEADRVANLEMVDGFRKSEKDRISSATEAAASQLKKHSAEHLQSVADADEQITALIAGQMLRSDETIEANNSKTGALIAELAVMKESIKEQLVQATGYGQFGAFQSRQHTIAREKYFWVAAIAVIALAVIGLTAFIAAHAQQSDLHSAAFWIKLSMNLPLGFLITFCTIQYNRERRLEEEYAFKASISISLTPYRELIYAILEKEGPTQNESYTNFVIDSVRGVFSSPTEKIYDSPATSNGISEKTFKSVAELIGTVLKSAK